MTKQQKQAMIEQMKAIVTSIKDADKNADGIYSADQIRNNMLQTFSGIQTSMEILTGTEWHYGFDGQTYAVVEIKKGKEIRHAL